MKWQTTFTDTEIMYMQQKLWPCYVQTFLKVTPWYFWTLEDSLHQPRYVNIDAKKTPVCRANAKNSES